MKLFHIPAPPPFYTNTFLVLDEQGAAAVIDPAAQPQEYTRLLQEYNAKLTHIFHTHGHYDHVDAAEALRTETGAEIYLAREDRVGGRLFPLTSADHDYTDGETISVGALSFQVMRTPGHSQGSVCLLCEDVLFSGDTLFAGEIGRCDLQGGDFATMQRSLKKLCDAVPFDAQVLPGHDAFSTMDAEKASNPYLQAR